MSAKIVGELRDWCAFVRAAPTKKIEVDPLGLSCNIEHAVAQSDRFREISHRIDGDLIRVELEWCRTDKCVKCVAEVDRDFYQIYWLLSEDFQFLCRLLDGEAVVYHVVSGSMDGKAGHVHFAEFRIVGPDVRRAIEGYRQVEAGVRELRD